MVQIKPGVQFFKFSALPVRSAEYYSNHVTLTDHKPQWVNNNKKIVHDLGLKAYTVQPLYNEGPSFVITTFFSIYFTVTGVNKIVRHTEDFVI